MTVFFWALLGVKNMQVSITGHHVEVTEAMKQHVEEKIGKLKRHFDNVTDVHVILTVEKLEQKAEATVQISGATLFADDVQENMYTAIDSMVDKLDRQIIKHKEKTQARRS
jgi:putative sigma-54 modulation protein